MTTARRSRRPLFVIAAVGAALVTAIFATVGDGVAVEAATGVRAAIVDHGHTLVWALLTVAFTIAAVRGGWVRPAGAVAVTAAIVYAVFLFAVFLWP